VQYLQFRTFENAEPKKKPPKKRSASVLRPYSPINYYCIPINYYCILHFMKRGPLRGPFIHPRGGGVTVVQGTVAALFYTKFERKKGHFLSLGGVYTPNTPPRNTCMYMYICCDINTMGVVQHERSLKGT
jgi:hypothetical protein